MQLASYPRFRTDLVAECIETDGQRFIDVIDPDTGDAFRFYEVEYSIACAMDGERDVAGLVQWAKEELGIEPSPTELQTVITTLGDLGYLEAAQAAAQVAAERDAPADGDDYGLARGVHAPARTDAMPSGADVELGHASAPAFAPHAGLDTGGPSASDVELGIAGGQSAEAQGGPPADDLELGAPGAAEPMPTLRRGKTRPDIDDDGPTNLPMADAGTFDDDEVSVDLSQHLDLGRDDVKEAVRMSRSMQAVQVPQDLLDQLGDQEAAIASRAQAAKDEALEARRKLDAGPVATDAVVPTPPPVETPIARPPVVAEVKPTEPVKPVPKVEPAKPVTRPKEPTRPPADNARPIAVAEPSGGGVSTFLVVLLVLALLGGGAFFVYKYILSDKKSDDTAEATPGTGSSKAKKGTGAGTAKASGSDKASGSQVASGTGTGTASGTGDVQAPPAPTAKLEAVPGAPIDISGGPDGGVVAWAADDGATVAVGDPVIQYKGVEYFKGKLGNSRAGLIREIEVSVPGEIDKTTAQRDKAAAAGNGAEVKRLDKYIAERTKRLGQKQEEAKKLQTKIDGFTIKAPAAGVVHPKFAVGKRVAKNAVAAQLDGAPMLAAKFTLDAAKSDLKVEDSIRIAPKGVPEKSVTCLVSAVDGTTVTVTCGADLGFSAGADVQIAP